MAIPACTLGLVPGISAFRLRNAAFGVTILMWRRTAHKCI